MLACPTQHDPALATGKRYVGHTIKPISDFVFHFVYFEDSIYFFFSLGRWGGGGGSKNEAVISALVILFSFTGKWWTLLSLFGVKLKGKEFCCWFFFS